MSRVVIAYVATLRLESEMRFSRSTLQVATLDGCVRASEASVRVAANLRDDFGDERKSCKTNHFALAELPATARRHVPAIGFVSCAADTFFISQIARAASKFTMSLL